MFEPPEEPQDGAPEPVSEPVPGSAEWAVPGVDRPPVVEPAPADLLALTSAVDGLVPDRGALSDRQLLERTGRVFDEAHRLQLHAVALLAEVHRRQAYRLDGVATTSRWIGARKIEVDPKQVALAKAFGRFPAVAAQVLDGRLGLVAARQVQLALAKAAPHLDARDELIDGQPGQAVLTAVVVDGIQAVITQARGGFPRDDDPVLQQLIKDLPVLAADTGRTQLQRLEAALLVLAEHVEVGQLAGALGLLTDALLPSLLQDRADRQHDRRGLTLVRHSDGTGWSLRGELDLQCGERLWLVLQTELARDADAPLDTQQAAALREQGLDPYDPDLPSTTSPRSTAEKQHDAFDHGLGRYLEADLGGSTGKDSVHIVVTVPLATLDGEPGALPAVAGSGAALPAALVRAWACRSPLSRHVLSLTGRVLADSHPARTLSRRQRRALRTQTGGHCQGAGCRRSGTQPGTVLHPHHANPWSRCGTTSLTDTVLLCTSCHHDVHDGRRRLLLKDGRRLGPDGWTE